MPPDAVDGPITIRTPHGDVTSTTAFTVLPPRLIVARDANEGFEVSWPATSSAFVVETTGSLDFPTWTPVETSFVVTNGHTVFRLGAMGSSRFYRLKKR